jgi:hypothetical protein
MEERLGEGAARSLSLWQRGKGGRRSVVETLRAEGRYWPLSSQMECILAGCTPSVS